VDAHLSLFPFDLWKSSNSRSERAIDVGPVD